VWRQSALDLDLREEVDAVVSTATLHWVPEHDRLWVALGRALRPGGVLEALCGGAGNIARVRAAIGHAAQTHAPELIGFSPWVFATPEETPEYGTGATKSFSDGERADCFVTPQASIPSQARPSLMTTV
jgi:trans-aconitate 2-methyltransferase